MKRARPETIPDLFDEPRVHDGSSAGASTDLRRTVPVVVTLPLDEPFDYRIAGEPPAPGSVVEVPFGPRDVLGVVWPSRGGRVIAPDRLKPVRRRLEAPPLPPALLRLVEHVRETSLAPLGNALKLALPVPAALEPPPVQLGLRRADAPPETRMTPARQRVLEVLDNGAVLASAELARRAAVGSGVVQGMVKAGVIEPAPLAVGEPARPDPNHPALALSPAQAEVAGELRRAVGRGHRTLLLEGVPGAGKTEVYLEAVAEALRQGLQALVLLPEIALGAQLLERFARRFGAPPAVWHSDLSSAERRRTWRAIAEGRAPIVIGARSALFLPLTRLGVIVVDEEHDQSFKQEDGVCYHGRDMAVARAGLEDCPIILASATPALDSAHAAGRIGTTSRAGRAFLLPHRHGGAALPTVHLVDLKRDRPPAGRWLAPGVVRALEATLERGEQALLFLNRRGFAPLTLCRACGQRLKCPNCAAWLVSHRFKGRLLCHHCGFSRPTPEFCPGCGTVDSLVPCGPGVERLAEEVLGLLPGARSAIMTSDSPSGPKAAAELVRAMHDHDIDLLIGTQIIAKGHHFPDLTLVGVVDGDLGLAGGDLRAGERQFQLLYQVAGRAGRSGKPGMVLIQTHLPEHPVMQALKHGDKDRFYAEELAQREEAGLPPFGQLAALILSGRDLGEVQRFARDVARSAPSLPGFRVLGPAPAPLALLRGRYRQRLLVIARPEVDLQATLRPWVAAQKPRGTLALQVDVDPYSFL